jgi:hypothetical protein
VLSEMTGRTPCTAMMGTVTGEKRFDVAVRDADGPVSLC